MSVIGPVNVGGGGSVRQVIVSLTRKVFRDRLYNNVIKSCLNETKDVNSRSSEKKQQDAIYGYKVGVPGYAELLEPF